jgi:CRP/FNR family transcriptional regulator
LPAEASEIFNSIKITHSYPRGTTLFAEGQPANGVYVICAGRVKLSTYSEDGRAIIIRIAEAGEVIGLSAIIAGTDHEATAQVVEACHVNFVRAREFLAFVNKNGDAALSSLRELSRNYYQAHRQVCSLGLSASVGDKLARLLLEWYDHAAGNGADGVHIRVIYTHEEIAEMIGSSRETVTRLLKDFADRKLISLKKNDLHIPNRNRLSAALGTRRASNVM